MEFPLIDNEIRLHLKNSFLVSHRRSMGETMG